MTDAGDLGWWGVLIAVLGGAIRVSTPYLFVSLGETLTEKGGRVNLGLEGILVMAEPELRSELDLKIFVDTDPDLRLARRLERDIAERGRSVDSVIQQYFTTVRPMHLEFVEPSRRYADLIIPEGFNPAAVATVVELIRSRLN